MFKVEAFGSKSLNWWRTMKDQIDMDPPYQRHGRLWSITDKAFLIDSILNGYDIPKIYIADFTFSKSKLNRKRLNYAIIDGKQRFEAIFDFYDGNITLDDNFVYLDNSSLSLKSLSYQDLRKNHPIIADKFDSYNLSVMHVITDDEKRIEELFIRLNRSKPLTGAEIRNAMRGPIPGIIRELVKHEIFNSCIKFPTLRGDDKNAATKILMFEYSDGPKETKRKNLDDFVKKVRSQDKGTLELATRRVIDSFERMCEIFLPRDKLLNSAGLFPVYYWFVRSIKPQKDLLVREFLVNFKQRRKQLKKTENYPKTGGGVLNEFELLNRSTNDEKSHIRRVEILLDEFNKYIDRIKT